MTVRWHTTAVPRPILRAEHLPAGAWSSARLSPASALAGAMPDGELSVRVRRRQTPETFSGSRILRPLVRDVRSA